jgi:hypothetical protein
MTFCGSSKGCNKFADLLAHDFRIRDILAPMNYLRGFQRLYAVVALLWISFVLFATQSGRWKPWPYMPREQWEIESETPIIPPTSASAPGPVKANGPEFTLSPEKFLRDATRQEERHRNIVRWSWVVGLVLLPPAFGYFLLFYVSRWIYRGFRPETHA